VRGSAAYTIPVIDVRFSATVASRPGLERTATWQVPISVVQSLLGRIPPGSSIGGTPLNVALLDTNDHRLYADRRRNQVGRRIAKILRFGGMRADVGLDLTNLLNTNYPRAYENTYQYGPPNGGHVEQPDHSGHAAVRALERHAQLLARVQRGALASAAETFVITCRKLDAASDPFSLIINRRWPSRATS
jgi:hypothetical protein